MSGIRFFTCASGGLASVENGDTPLRCTTSHGWIADDYLTVGLLTESDTWWEIGAGEALELRRAIGTLAV